MSFFREFLAGSDFLVFPQIALVIFFIVFVAVLGWFVRSGRRNPSLERMAELPLDDSEGSARQHE